MLGIPRERWRNVRGSQEAQASGREWRLRFYKRNGGNGFLKQTCGTYLFSAVRHILKTSTAEGWQPIVQLTVAKSSISTIVRWFAAVT